MRPPPSGGGGGATRPQRPGHHRPAPSRPSRPRPGYTKPRPNQYFWRGRWFGRYRAPAFVYPRGYSYRIWYPGNRLPLLFLTTQFFFDNFRTLGLEVPPPGYRWVRYGPDLLLVNVRTGDIDDVIYGAFY